MLANVLPDRLLVPIVLTSRPGGFPSEQEAIHWPAGAFILLWPGMARDDILGRKVDPNHDM